MIAGAPGAIMGILTATANAGNGPRFAPMNLMMDTWALQPVRAI